MLNSMEGYRVYANLILIFLGWFGVKGIISNDQLANMIDLGMQLIGMIGVAYYNYKNHIQITELKGLAGIK